MERLSFLLLFTVLILIAPLFLIGFDFWSGIRKARLRGEEITSDGWKRTVYKIARYYNMLLALLVVDALQIGSFYYLNTFEGWSMPLFPWFTLCGMLFISAIEIKSIAEPATAKERKEMKKVALLGKAIAEHKTKPEEIAEVIIEYINENNKNE